MKNYSDMLATVKAFLAKNFPGVSTATDILEITLLMGLLGFEGGVPEKFLVDCADEANFLVYLRTPYEVPREQVKADLKKCIKNTPISMEEMGQNRENFIFKLTVPYKFMEKNKEKFFGYMQDLLSNQEKYAFFKYWSEYVERNPVALTVRFIEHEVSKLLQVYPHALPDEMWNAIIMKASGNDKKLTILAKKVAIDVENWPQIKFDCTQEDSSEKVISLTRSEILKVIDDPAGLAAILSCGHEYTLSYDTLNVVQRKFLFKCLENGKYEVDLGYHDDIRNTLKGLGIEMTLGRLGDGQRSRYYVMDEQNYFKAVLAIAEVKGWNCLEERLHTLKYYCDTEDWVKLEKQLDFALKFKSHTGLNIDYTELAFKLFDYAKKNEIHGSLTILLSALDNLAKNTDDEETSKKAHKILFETTLWEMTQLDQEGGTSEEKQELKTKLFEHSFKAKLPMAANYFAELCGYGAVNPFSAAASDPTALLIECASIMNAKDKKIAALEQQLAEAQAQPHQQVSSFSRGAAFFQSQRQQLVEEPQNPQKSVELSVTRK